MTTRVTLRNFQSFDEKGAGVGDVKRINVLVGPNNVGKSKILRAIDRTINDHSSSLIAEAASQYSVVCERPLSEQELKRAFPPNTGNHAFGGDNWEGFGKWLFDSTIVAEFGASKGLTIKAVTPKLGTQLKHLTQHAALQYAQDRVVQAVNADTFEKFSSPVHYIAAERDVKAEPETANDKIGPDGTGVTNLLRMLTRTVGKEKHRVEHDLLLDLNEILWPDHEFKRIDILQHPDRKTWEIFLEEKGKGLVPLSQCGSGLRTLIHLLTHTNIISSRSSGKIRKGTFLFEELENCLHPHVQRNLFAYLDEVIASPARVFLTTHSSICLDYFQGHDDVVLTHVHQENGKTRSRTVEAFRDHCGVLDRMGSRASDALQSNAVVWVEGPSDRTFLKHWFSLCGATLREGRDYSIMFYGGDLLAHLTANPEQELEEYVRLLRINRNSAIIMDSDKTYRSESIRETKRRVRDEADKHGCFAWITKGKEIENYIAAAFFDRHFDKLPAIDRYENPWKKLQGKRPHGMERALNTKVEFAEFVSRNSTEADFHLDWKEQTLALLQFIKVANGLND